MLWRVHQFFCKKQNAFSRHESTRRRLNKPRYHFSSLISHETSLSKYHVILCRYNRRLLSQPSQKVRCATQKPSSPCLQFTSSQLPTFSVKPIHRYSLYLRIYVLLQYHICFILSNRLSLHNCLEISYVLRNITCIDCRPCNNYIGAGI